MFYMQASHYFFNITSDFVANYDYIGLKDTITFGPMKSIQCVDIQIVGDSLAEGLESFTVQVTSNSSEIVVLTSQVIVHIQKSDGKKINSVKNILCAV